MLFFGLKGAFLFAYKFSYRKIETLMAFSVWQLRGSCVAGIGVWIERRDSDVEVKSSIDATVNLP